jgi:uncharacterized repeat protein (TIGR02543 family)
VQVANETKAPVQANPEVAGKVFTGWYYTDDKGTEAIDDDEDIPFHFNSTIITEDMTVTAYFSDSVNRVTFYKSTEDLNLDSYMNVLETKDVKSGDLVTTVSYPDGQEPENMIFTGNWIVRSSTDSNLTVGAAYDFDEPVVGDIDLEPEFKFGYTVNFDSGGSLVESQNVYSGDKLDKPEDPKRSGYTFAGWYTKPGASGVLYDFSTLVTEDSDLIKNASKAGPTLYGKWTPKKVNYTIEYWVEKTGIVDADNNPVTPGNPTEHPENYEYVASHASTAAEQRDAGSTMTFEDIKAVADNTANKNLTYSSNPAMQYSSMFYMNPKASVVISGSGNTVIKVYYVRDVYKVAINAENSNVGTSNLGTSAAQAYLVHDGIEYQTTTNPTKYSFYLKYGQDITTIWPRLSDIKTSVKTPFGWKENGNTTEPHQNFDVADSSVMAFVLSKPKVNNVTVTSPYDNANCYAGEVFVVYSTNLLPTYMPVYTEATDKELIEINEYIAGGGEVPLWVNNIGPLPVAEMDGTTFVPYFYNSVVGKYFVLNDGPVMWRMYTKGVVGGGSQTTYSPNSPTYSSVPPMMTSTVGTSSTDISKSIKGTPIYLPGATNLTRGVQYQYSVQQRNEFSVYIDNNDGSAPVEFKESAYGNMVGELPAPAPREGFNFKGWYLEKECITPFDAETQTITGKMTIFAKWEAVSVDVAFYPNTSSAFPLIDLDNDNLNGYQQSFPMGGLAVNPTATSEDPNAGPDPAYCGVPEDAVFLGWYIKVNNGWIKYNFENPVEKNLNLYARWNYVPPTYTVTYDDDGATAGNKPVDTNKYLSGSTFVIKNGSSLVKDDRIFIGWQLSSNANGPLYQSGSSLTMPNTNVVLTAIYAAPTNKANVIFHSNIDDSDTTQVWNSVEGATVVWPSNSYLGFERDGYTFEGWNTDKDATELDPQYKPGKKFKLPVGTTTLYAVWKLIPTYKVTYDGNDNTGGTVPEDLTPYRASAEVTVKDKDTMVKEGYYFLGWDKDKLATSPEYKAGDKFNMPAEDQTLYAIWKLVPVQTPPNTPEVTPHTTDPTDPEIAPSDVATPDVATQDTPTPAVTDSGDQTTAGQEATDDTDDKEDKPETQQIGNVEIPRDWFDSDSWALINLVLAIAAVLVMIMGMIRAIVVRRKNEENQYDGTWEERRVSLLWIILSIVGSVVGGIIFILTQDMLDPMTLIDNWTIAHIILFVIVTVSAFATIKRETSGEVE